VDHIGPVGVQKSLKEALLSTCESIGRSILLDKVYVPTEEKDRS
jgi:hypothetical protein